jgi:hypothetical protein
MSFGMRGSIVALCGVRDCGQNSGDVASGLSTKFMGVGAKAKLYGKE